MPPKTKSFLSETLCMCGGWVGAGSGQGGWGVEGGLWPPAPGHMCSVPTSRVFSVLPIFRSNIKKAIFSQMKIQHFDYLSSKLFFPFAFKDTFLNFPHIWKRHVFNAGYNSLSKEKDKNFWSEILYISKIVSNWGGNFGSWSQTASVSDFNLRLPACPLRGAQNPKVLVTGV